MSESIKGSLTLNEVLGDFADRITNLEHALAQTEESLKSVNEMMEKYQENLTALQIASMLLLLRAVGVKEENVHKEMTGYLDMSRVYAKKFLSGEKNDAL